MIHNNINDMPAEEAKAVLAGIPRIRMAAEEYDWEAAKRDPAIKYVFNSAAEKFGYDVWNYLIKSGAISIAKQEKLSVG